MSSNNNSFLPKTPLAYISPEDMLADIRQQLPALTDYQWTDFLESDLGYAIIKTMMYIMDYSLFYLDQKAKEAYLSLATEYSSALSISKMLGYKPYGYKSAEVTVQISHPRFTNNLIIPKNSLFRINGFYFSSKAESIIAVGTNTTTLDLIQGYYISQTMTSKGDLWQKYTFPLNFIIEDVLVDGTSWEYTPTFINPTSEESYTKWYEGSNLVIMFGGNIQTAAPAAGSKIVISGYLSDGVSANTPVIDVEVQLDDALFDTANNPIQEQFSGITVTPIMGGSDIESLSSIQVNAPNFYSSQDRVVTEFDYKSIVLTVPGVKSCSVIGGEKLGRYGEVHIAVIPEDNIDRSNINQVLDLIKLTLKEKNIVTITPVVSSAQFITIDCFINVWPTKNVLFKNLNQGISIAVTEFFSKLDLGQSIKQSDLIALLEQVEYVDIVEVTFMCRQTASDAAGKVTIPLVKNPDILSLTFSKDATNIKYDQNNMIYSFYGTGSYTISYGVANTSVFLKENQCVTLGEVTINYN
jgi:hypothetical protein